MNSIFDSHKGLRSDCIIQHTHTHPFNGSLSGTTRVSQNQKVKTNLDFTGARDSEWQWHQLGHMQICTSLQTDNHASSSLLSFLLAGCPSCRPTNSVKALKATVYYTRVCIIIKLLQYVSLVLFSRYTEFFVDSHKFLPTPLAFAPHRG